MNPEARAKLDQIVKKEIAALTAPDIAFLKARRDYLTKEQLETFDKVLKKPLKPEKPKEAPVYISYKDLQRKAKAMGLPYRSISRADLERSIDTIEGPGGAPTPE